MGLDWDDVLGFKTEAKVVVRHRWLGGIYYVAMLAIVLYTIISTIVLKEGYVRQLDLTGSAVRSTVRGGDSIATNAQYCDKSVLSGSFAERLPCVYPDYESNVLSKTTVGADGALLIGTRYSKTIQMLNRSLPYGSFQWATTVEKQSKYILGVEDATIMIQNAVSRASQSAYGGDGSSYIIDSFDKTRSAAIMYNPENGRAARVTQLKEEGGGDIITVGQLLDVAGISLDDKVPELGYTESYRYEGLTISVEICYEGKNMGSDEEKRATYSYNVSVTGLPAKTTTADIYGMTNDADPSMRRINDLRGIQVIFSVTSNKLRVWDFQILFVSLLSGVALIAIAKTIADAFLLYLAPRREDYRLFVETATPDFGPDNEHEKQILEQILTDKRNERDRVLSTIHRHSQAGPTAEPLKSGSKGGGPVTYSTFLTR